MSVMTWQVIHNVCHHTSYHIKSISILICQIYIMGHSSRPKIYLRISIKEFLLRSDIKYTQIYNPKIIKILRILSSFFLQREKKIPDPLKRQMNIELNKINVCFFIIKTFPLTIMKLVSKINNLTSLFQLFIIHIVQLYLL